MGHPLFCLSEEKYPLFATQIPQFRYFICLTWSLALPHQQNSQDHAYYHHRNLIISSVAHCGKNVTHTLLQIM